MKKIIKKIYQEIKKYDTIVIARHIGPDPDAVASQTALRDSIKLTFPNKKVFSVGLPVAKYKYYGPLDKIDESKLKNALLIVLDLPNIARLDGVEDITKYKSIIRIDHHPTEDIKANVAWTQEGASSTAQLISELLLDSKLILNKSIAGKLFLGIVSDSDRFLVNNTSSQTFKIVNRLLEKEKLDLAYLYNKLYLRPLNEVKFEGYISLNMTISKNKFGFIKLTKEIANELNVDANSASNMINNFNYIKELLCWVFISFDERSKIYRINIRSRGPIINEIASKYNGGGHKLASGARLKEESEVDALLEELDNKCKEYIKENEGKDEIIEI